ncbi:hypothetical protein ACFFRL_19600 [Agromyces hippuratus]|uniref:hypothetical protein n=1 Tax=Agromyces hippuratus TaxID=286438 RepID=UPI0035E94335
MGRDRDADGRRDGAVDAREPAVGVHGDAATGHRAVGIPDEARGAEEEPVVRPGRRPDGVDEHAPGDGRPHRGELGLHVLALRLEVGDVAGLVDAVALQRRRREPGVDEYAARPHPRPTHARSHRSAAPRDAQRGAPRARASLSLALTPRGSSRLL